MRTEVLPAKIVEAWERRIGIDSSSHAAPAPIRLRGPAGLAYRGQNMLIDVDDPYGFESLVYSRRLSSIRAFCSLETPRRLERNRTLIDESPSDNLMVAVRTLPGRTVLRQGTADHTYRPGQLMVVNNAAPFVEISYTIADAVGLVIPLSLLGTARHTVEQNVHPVAPNTILARATTAFIQQLAVATATGAIAPDPDCESAVVELIRAVLGQLDDNRKLGDNQLYIRHAALELIDRHHRDSRFTPGSIARTLHVSKRQLYRYFEDTDESVAALIADRRLRTAHEMVTAEPTLPIAEVAAASGFPSVATMRNRFRGRYGVSPNELRSVSLITRSTAAVSIPHSVHASAWPPRATSAPVSVE